MTTRRFRTVLSLSLCGLGLVAWIFYVRQNSGQQVGGAISVPKMLWLTYAIAAWFVVPPFLWRDSRIDGSVRRLFGVFWAAMLVRGVIEMVLVYGFSHWTPWYGIGHDLFCVGLLLMYRRQVIVPDQTTRRAFRFSTSLLIVLLAETAFAAMFLMSGVHRDAVYFASSDASWALVNGITTVVLVFAIPDLIATLIVLYFPGATRTAPRVAHWLRGGAAATALLAVTGGLGLWIWMSHVENHAARFQQTGFAVAASCKEFADAFLRSEGNVAEQKNMADFVDGATLSWNAEPVSHGHPFTYLDWKPNESSEPLISSLRSWRRDFQDIDQATFKVHLIDEFGDGWCLAQIRFEVTGGDRTDAGMLRLRFESRASRWRVTDAELISGRTVRADAGTDGHAFVDRAEPRGLDFRMHNDPRFTPCQSCTEHECAGPTKLRFQTMRHAYAGSATADFDGDGADDLFLGSGERAALYRNRGDGSFELWTERAGVGELWHVNTAGFADFDNDGDQDLFLGRFFGRNQIFANRGDGTFEDVTENSGLAQDDQVTCFSFFDYDRDGDLDIYLGRFLDATKEIPGSFLYARNGEPNRLYRNDGGLRFQDVTSAAGVGDVGLALSLAAADFDDDGDQDLYVANDFGRNVLYRNHGDGTFSDVAAETGTLAIGGSMSASWGDYDNDGRLDLYVAAIRSNQRWFVQPITAQRVVLKFLREGKLGSDNPLLSDLRRYMGADWVNIGNHALAGNSLLRQEVDGTFTERADEADARPAGWYWSSGFLDFDHDGDLDLLATNGWISGEDSHDL